jgi:hypothetical protein
MQRITWAPNCADHVLVLEFATALPALQWDPVTILPTPLDGPLSVTLDADDSPRFYRLRKP